MQRNRLERNVDNWAASAGGHARGPTVAAQIGLPSNDDAAKHRRGSLTDALTLRSLTWNQRETILQELVLRLILCEKYRDALSELELCVLVLQ